MTFIFDERGMHKFNSWQEQELLKVAKGIYNYSNMQWGIFEDFSCDTHTS